MADIWAHSGDSHFLEPEDLWTQILPAGLAERMPRSERVSETEEVIHVDGRSFRRSLPAVETKKGEDGLTVRERHARPPGARDARARLADLDGEGIWGEVVFASVGLWENMIEDRDLVRAASAAQNEWRIAELQNVAPDRLVATASIPVLDLDDAVSEVEHAAEIGFHAVALPTGVPHGVRDWNHDSWDPLWRAIEQAELVLTFHVGTDTAAEGEHTAFRGPGGAVLNYVESTYSGQRVATKMVASGALDRHPGIKMLVAEGGSTWVPFLGDRMVEGYRQHAAWVRPKLSRSPKEILFDQVYTSFQHDESAPAALTAMGYNNVMWGSDYPHMEGTYGHTQQTLHELFDDIDPAASERIRVGAFRELFPHIPVPPAQDRTVPSPL